MKTNLDKFVKTDASLESQGIEMEFGDVVFTVRRFGGRNPKLKAAQTKYFKPHARGIEQGTLSEDTVEEITVKAFVDSCLVNWRGLKDEKGQEIPFTFDNAVSLFRGRIDLFESILNYAKDHRNFLEDEFFTDESLGN